jgi:hypothetical protein
LEASKSLNHLKLREVVRLPIGSFPKVTLWIRSKHHTTHNLDKFHSTLSHSYRTTSKPLIPLETTKKVEIQIEKIAKSSVACLFAVANRKPPHPRREQRKSSTKSSFLLTSAKKPSWSYLILWALITASENKQKKKTNKKWWT